MSTTEQPQETDLLVPEEIQNIPAKYREYYAIKRNNFFASIQGFPEMWKYYHLLDAIWLRELEDMEVARQANRVFRLMLYVNVHAKIRIAMELAFSGCMAEARSILRDAVEFVAHAHHMLKDPELQTVWLDKDVEEEAFKDAFERNKKRELFDGLKELHERWGELSELGVACNTPRAFRAFCNYTHGRRPALANQLYRWRPARVGYGALCYASDLLRYGEHIFQRLQDEAAARQ